MRVLLIKTSSMGDVIHSLPALTDAATAVPGIRFDWVVEEGFAQICAWHPAVQRAIPVAIRRWRRHLWRTWRNGEWRHLKQGLRKVRYDLVIDAQGLLKSALLTRYPEGPVAGFDRHSAREPLATCFYDRRYAVPWEQHAVQRIRQLFAQALGYGAPDGTPDYGLDRTALAAPGTPPYLVLLHGTTWPSKHWPEARWRQLAVQLNDLGWRLRIPWGNVEEQARAQRLAAGLTHTEVLPRLDLNGIARVIAGARACVAVDTGLGHLAAALDVPTLSLYGPTRPERVGAYGRHQAHLCADGPNAGRGDRHAPCFDDLTVTRVGAALQALLQQTEPSLAGKP